MAGSEANGEKTTVKKPTDPRLTRKEEYTEYEDDDYNTDQSYTDPDVHKSNFS